MARNGILCLEGDWEDGLIRRKSLVPVLKLLRSQWDIPFIYRIVPTRDEFKRVIDKWGTSAYSKFNILYLGFHGEPGALRFGDEQVPIRDLWELHGKGQGRIVHFGSCETLNISPREIERFFKQTQFQALCGFGETVDWLHCCALEILILDQLSSRAITSHNVQVFRKRIKEIGGSLARELDFRVWTRSDLKK